ncbi:hypothetical protein BJ508DRAFT_182727 [Ascobolus immersus RN42]|uniref:Uncharacterized protein n=1 Tax=Ascobolus immersus RN42 TaxID=1160509 RepID=A0A3N4HRT3_ASCIM|nr:hypothetical protein BJ508DRAFT_182727 [Ascobolus immersus RN42]
MEREKGSEKIFFSCVWTKEEGEGWNEKEGGDPGLFCQGLLVTTATTSPSTFVRIPRAAPFLFHLPHSTIQRSAKTFARHASPHTSRSLQIQPSSPSILILSPFHQWIFRIKSIVQIPITTMSTLGEWGKSDNGPTERLDWSAEVTEELGWQTATRRRPNRNPNSALRPTALSFEPTKSGAGQSSSRSSGYAQQTSLGGPRQQTNQTKLRKNFQNRHDKSSPINVFDGNVESRQGNSRPKRQVKDESKGSNSRSTGPISILKKSSKGQEKEKASVDSSWVATKTLTEVPKQANWAQKAAKPLHSPQKDKHASGEKERKEAPKKITILMRVAAPQPDAVTAAPKQLKKAKEQNSANMEEPLVGPKLATKQPETKSPQSEELVLPVVSKPTVTVSKKERKASAAAYTGVIFSFGAAKQIEGALSLPPNLAGRGRSIVLATATSSKKRKHVSNTRGPTASKRGALNQPVSLPLSLKSKSRELSRANDAWRKSLRFGANVPGFVDVEILAEPDDIEMADTALGPNGLDEPGAFGYAILDNSDTSQTIDGHKKVPAVLSEGVEASQWHNALLQVPPAEWPTFVPKSQNESANSSKGRKTPKETLEINTKQDHMPPPSEWPTFVPSSTPSKMDSLPVKSSTGKKQSKSSAKKRAKRDNLVAKTPIVDHTAKPLTPTLQALKDRGGLVSFLPQHCQPVYAAGSFPESPPVKAPVGYMLCVDNPAKTDYAVGAFIEPTVEQDLFPDVDETGSYAFVLVLVKQLMFTLIDDNERGGEMTSELLDQEVTRLVHQISAGAAAIRNQDVRVLLLHDVRTPIFPNMLERNFTRFLSGMSKRVGTSVVYQPVEAMEAFVQEKLAQAAGDPNCAAIVGIGSYWNETLPHDISTDIALLHQQKKCVPPSKVLIVVHDAFYDDHLTVTHLPSGAGSETKAYDQYCGSFYVFRRHFPKIFATYNRIVSFDCF